MSLVTLADMKTYLGIAGTSQDVFLQRQLDVISDAVENYCGRKFAQASYVQTFYSQDFDLGYRKYIYTFHYPIISITEIKEVEPLTGGGTNETIIPATDYIAKLDTGKLKRNTTAGFPINWFFSYYPYSYVVVSYDAGYATIPNPIQDVVYSLVAERYNKSVNGMELNFGSDVQRVSIPGVMSIDFDYTLQSNERRTSYGIILGNYVNVLDDYVSERKLVGEIRDNYVV